MSHPLLKALSGGVAFAALISAGLIVTSQRGRADSEEGNEAKIRRGFAIAPVKLKMRDRNRDLVGLGSYLVNAVSACNSCHSAGTETTYSFGGIPYFGQHPTKINPDVYLGGGDSFGMFGNVEIVSRNITPDKDGRPAGMTFEEFVNVIRTGRDPDQWHPTCSSSSGLHCIPAPFDGSLLQVMPWPAYQNLRRSDLRAIYEYLSVIPCLEGDPGNPEGSDTHRQRCSSGK
jgi:hypothetical protein